MQAGQRRLTEGGGDRAAELITGNAMAIERECERRHSAERESDSLLSPSPSWSQLGSFARGLSQPSQGQPPSAHGTHPSLHLPSPSYLSQVACLLCKYNTVIYCSTLTHRLPAIRPATASQPLDSDPSSTMILPHNPTGTDRCRRNSSVGLAFTSKPRSAHHAASTAASFLLFGLLPPRFRWRRPRGTQLGPGSRTAGWRLRCRRKVKLLSRKRGGLRLAHSVRVRQAVPRRLCGRTPR